MNVIGDVEGRTCILQDDIVDTAGTMQKAATALRPTRAPSGCSRARCTACCRGRRSTRIEQSPIEKMIVTNTIPRRRASARAAQKIVVLSVARLLAQAIRSIHEESSVSSLFV